MYKMITTTQLSRIVRKFDNINNLHQLTLLTDLVKAEEKAFFQRKIKSVLEKEYQMGALGTDMERIKEYDNDLTKQLKEKNAKAHHNGWVWITVNCLESVPLGEFVKKIEAITQYSCHQGGMYVYEQRGTINQNNLGKGKHCHLLLKRNLAYKPSAVIFKIQRGLTKIVGNVKNNNQLNCQVIGDDFAEDKIQYMIGTKKTEKQEKQAADVVWRQKESLKTQYVFGDINPEN